MPDLWMDVDAALAEVPVNIMPLLDDTDFKTREVAITFDQAGMDLVWNFTTTAGAFTQTAVTPTSTGTYDWAHQGDGMYSIEIPASGGASINNDTEGFGWFTGFATGVLPWRGPVIGFRAAGLNNALIDSAYSATRGLAGTALPDAAADAAGGLAISDAGGLDLDAILADTNELQTDWANGGRLDLILDARADQTTVDAIETDTQDIQSRLPAALVGGLIDANVGAISTDTVAADNLELDYDGTGYAKVNSTIGTTTTNTDMRGTDNAALASVATEARLAELDAGNMPTDLSNIETDTQDIQSRLPAALVGGLIDSNVGAISGDTVAADNLELDYDGTGYVKVNSTIGTTTTNTDMRGTDNAALASVATEGRLAELDPANIPADLDAVLTDTADIQPKIGTLSDLGGGATIANNLSDMAGATFATGTDSQEAIRDRGDAAWTTGAGGSDRLLMVDTTIATLASQTSFTLTAGSADDNAYVNCTIVIEDASTATQKAIGVISAYTGATKTVTLKYDPGVFTMATTDKVYILAENSLKTTDQNRQLDVTATGAAGIDWANVENPTTAVDLSATDIQLVDTTTTNTDMRGTDNAALASVATEARLAELDAGNMPTDLSNIETDTQDIQSRLPAALVGGNISADVAAIQNNAITAAAIATDAIDADALATDAVDEIADGVWDEVLTGATHNVANSAGRRLREAGAPLIREETAQGPGTGNNQIQFDADASAVDGAYDPAVVTIIDSTGAGQTRMILEYDGATRTATVDRNWKVNPDATSVFQIIANPGREHVNEGLAQAGTSDTITLNTLASDQDNVYVGQAIFIRSGTGEDQTGLIDSYDGTTKIATMHDSWAVTPDSTSGYVVLPYHSHLVTDKIAEITGASDVPATPTLSQAMMLLYMRERNNTQVTTSERRILNDAGVEVLDAPMSDNGTVFSQGKLTDA